MLCTTFLILETEICKLKETKSKEVLFFENEDWRGCPEECIEDCDNCPLTDDDDYYGCYIDGCDDDCDDCEICEYHDSCDDCPMFKENEEKDNECKHNWMIIGLSNDGLINAVCTKCGKECDVEIDFSDLM